MLSEHETLRAEIVSYEPEYEQLHQYGMRVTEGQTDPQYVFLRQRLDALHEDWLQLHKMWDQRQALLTQALNFQVRSRRTLVPWPWIFSSFVADYIYSPCTTLKLLFSSFTALQPRRETGRGASQSAGELPHQR